MILVGNVEKPLRKPRKTLPHASSSEVQVVSEILSSPNKLHTQTSLDLIKEVPLPSSWYWQDKCLKKDQYICSKFEWLNNQNNNFEYIKSIIVDENSIRYFVRGKNVHGQQLKTQFSTVSELCTNVKIFDETQLCVGCADPRSSENGTQKIRSKSCLRLATGNHCCSECYLTLIESLKPTTTNKSSNSNAPKPGPSNSSQDVAYLKVKRPENISNAPPKIIKVNLKYQSPSKASMPLSDITNQHEEPDDSTCIADHSHDITNNQSIAVVEKSCNEKPTRSTITGDHNRLPNDQVLDAVVDSELLPDREAVTFKNICTSTTSSNASSTKDLEQRLIKQPTLLKTSNYPLRLYNLHTWSYGIYSPLKPFTMSSGVDQCSSKTIASPFLTNGISRQPSYLISKPVHVYRPRKNIQPRETSSRNNAVLKLSDIKDMKTHNGKIHVTLNGEPIVQPTLLHNVFHIERAADLRKSSRSTGIPQENTPSEEDKNDLVLAIQFFREECRTKKTLLRRISRLSEQLTK